MDRPAGVADQSVSFAAFTTATGAAVTVTSATAGLALWYRRGATGAKVPLTALTTPAVNDLATLVTVHTDAGILVIGGAEHRFDLPDAAFAVGVTSLEWGGEATGITIDGGVANLIGQANSAQATVANLGDTVTMAAAFAAMAPLNVYTAVALANAPSGLTSQETRDAMKLTPSAGDPAAGSVDKHLDDIVEDTSTTLPAAISQISVDAGLNDIFG